MAIFVRVVYVNNEKQKKILSTSIPLFSCLLLLNTVVFLLLRLIYLRHYHADGTSLLPVPTSQKLLIFQEFLASPQMMINRLFCFSHQRGNFVYTSVSWIMISQFVAFNSCVAWEPLNCRFFTCLNPAFSQIFALSESSLARTFRDPSCIASHPKIV